MALGLGCDALGGDFGSKRQHVEDISYQKIKINKTHKGVTHW